MGRNPLPGGSGSRALAIALATLVLASVIAPAFAGAAVATSASASPPEGMVGVPDANIVEDVPSGESVPLSVSDLRGSVMTTDYADTLEVTVTTPDRASDLVGPSSVTVSGGGEVALVISDDTHDAGRKIALPLAAVQDALGYAPEQVHGTHEEGERWSRPTSESGGLLVFEVPHFSSNAVTFESEVRLNGSPATDGASYSYDINDPDAAGDPSIQLTGSTASERDDQTASGLSDGSAVSLGVGGNLEPTGPANGEPQVVFSGERTTSAFSSSGTASGGDATTLDVGGTESPESVSVAFDGATDTKRRTISETAVSSATTTSYSIGGNVVPQDASVTFEGRSSSISQSQSGSVSPGASTTVTVGGNLAPEAETLSVTGGTGTQTYTEGIYGGSGVVTPEPTGDVVSWEFDIHNPTDFEKSPMVELHTGAGSFSEFVSDMSPGETRTVVYDSIRVAGGSEISVETAVDTEIEGTTVTTEGATPDVTVNGDTTDFGAVSAGETKSQTISLSNGDNAIEFAGTGDYDYSIFYDEVTATDSPGLDLDGDGTTDVSHDGILTSGETVTSDVSLSLGSRTAEVMTDGGTVSWSLDFTERTGVKNPGVDFDGDGYDDATHSGILLSGESATSNVSTGVLTAGSPSVSFSGSGPAFGYTINATEVWHTHDPAVDLNGDGTNEASLSGELSPGEMESVALPSLSLATETATVSTGSGSSVGADFQFRERTETVAPKVEINGDWTNYSTRIPDGETVNLTASASSIVEGTNRVNVSVGDDSLTADAPTPRVGLVYSHSAASSVTTDYSGSTWSETYEVSKRWTSDRADANLVIPFAGNVVQTRDVLVGPDSGNLTATSDYSLDGTKLTVDLGSVSAGDETVVQVTGSKVLVNDGGISVTQATTEGNLLGTEFEITEKGSDFWISVNGTSPGANLHHLANESWASSDYAAIDSGTQRLYAPDAPVGGTATARTLPLEVIPQTDAEVEVLDPSTPKLELRPGSTSGDEVVFRWLDTVSGETYELASETRDGYVVDTAKAESPVDLISPNDGEEVFTIGVYDSGSASSGGSSSGGGGGGLAPVAATQGDGILRSPIVIAPLTVALILGAVLIARRTPVPLSVAGGSSVLVGLLAFESIAPGSVSSIFTQFGQQLASGVGTVSPALLLAGGAVGIWGIYRLVKRFTGRRDVNLTVTEGR